MIRADKKEEKLRHIWSEGKKIDEIRHWTQIRRKMAAVGVGLLAARRCGNDS